MENKFPHDKFFNKEFDKIENLKFYPYVGKEFRNSDKKIWVLAHNVPVKSATFESEIAQAQKDHFVNDLTNYAYLHEKWTLAFRKFLKGSLSLKSDYSITSQIEVIETIDNFVGKIAFGNYINGFVESDKQINVVIPIELIEKSHSINRKIINTLEVTHIICWGKQVFEHILNLNDSQNEIYRFSDFEKNLPQLKLKNRNGFEYAKINIDNRTIDVLKVFHPSMPNFGAYNESTHKIINWFLNLQKS